MKRKSFVFGLFSIIGMLSLIGCQQGGGAGGNDDESKSVVRMEGSSSPLATRSQSLDYLFGTDTVAEISINIDRSEWNKMLKYYDWWDHNEEYVKADCIFSKELKSDGKVYQWEMPNVGFRIRGNTSRKRPQRTTVKDGVLQEEDIYYGPGNNNYKQAHFKIDFEEFLESGESRVANCIKGLMLKRFKSDPTYAREIYGYNYFRENDVWLSPRAGYAHLTINIKDSEDSIEEVDYGIYAMIEQIDKQFLKERTESQGGGDFVTNDGNLWKCTGGASLADDNDSSMGVEKKSFNDFEWSDDILTTENPGKKEDWTPSYDLKTNKKKINAAKTELLEILRELNSLNEESDIKEWFETNTDVSMLLKTYACNVALGMWDDYWNNNNNYYFYVDHKADGSRGKFYFIPYDYDNILGINSGVDFAKQSPFEWSVYGKPAPLITKALKVEEFFNIYKEYLKEVTKSGSYFDPNVAKSNILKWQKMISGKIYSSKLLWQDKNPDLQWDGGWTYSDTFASFADYPETSKWGNPYVPYTIYTLGSNNYFSVRKECIDFYLGLEYKPVFNVYIDGVLIDTVQSKGGTILKTLEDNSKIKNKLDALKSEGNTFIDWAGPSGYITNAPFNSETIDIHAVYVNKDKLPVIYDENDVGAEVKIVFRPEDYYKKDWRYNESINNYEEVPISIAEFIQEMEYEGEHSSKKFNSIFIRGCIVEGNDWDVSCAHWNYEDDWHNLIRMDYDESMGYFVKSYPKSILEGKDSWDNYGGTIFGFVIGFDSSWDGGSGYGWEKVEYNETNYYLPDEVICYESGEDWVDNKYNLKRMTDCFKK